MPFVSRTSLFILLSLHLLSVTASPTVFGVNLALHSTNFYLKDQVEANIGLEVWRDWWNALPESHRTTKWGEVIDVELHIETWSEYGDWTSEGLASLCQIYGNMTLNSSISYYFTPVAFRGVDVRRCTHQDYGIDLMIGSTDSSDRYYEIPGSFGSPSANTLTMTSWLPYLRISRAKTIAVLRVNDWIYQSEMCQGLVDQAEVNELKVVYYQDMPFGWDAWDTYGALDTQEKINTWSLALDRIINLNPDAVVVCDYGHGSQFSLDHFRKNKWTPKSMAISPISVPIIDATLLDYVVIPAQYSSVAKYSPQSDFTTSAGYAEIIKSRYGLVATSEMAQATLAGMMYTAALVASPGNRTTDIINTLRLIQIPSFMGLVAHDVGNRQKRDAIVTQMMKSMTETNVVGPATAAVEEFIYPMPKWDERSYKQKWGSKVEIASVVLIAVSVVIILSWAVFLVYNRKHRVIIAASPVFCALILFGGFWACMSLVVWMPNLVSNVTCMLRPWLLPIGFMIMFCSLLAKTDRINQLFTLDNMKIIKITNGRLSLNVLAMVGAQVVLSILMVSIQRLQANIVVPDPYRLSRNYYVCSFPTATKVVFGINIAYGVGLLVWGTYLTYHVRKVPASIYDESRVIAFSIYNIVALAVVIIAIQLAVGNSNRDLTFMIIVICTLLGVVATISCLFIAKVYAMYSPEYGVSGGFSRKGASVRRSGNMSGNSSTAHSSANDEELDDVGLTKEIKKAVVARRVARREVKEISSRIKKLESMKGKKNKNDD